MPRTARDYTPRQIAAILKNQTLVLSTRAAANAFLGQGISPAYQAAVKAHHDALVENHRLMYGPEAAATLKRQTTRARRSMFAALAKVS